MQALDTLLQENVGKVYTAAQVEIRQHNAVIYRTAVGSLDPDGAVTEEAIANQPVRLDTFFDFASLTKLFTTTAFFRLLSAGHVALDTPVSSILPEFSGPRPIRAYDHPLIAGEKVAVVPPTDQVMEAGEVTFWHLLTHSSGLPAWINLRNAETEPDRLQMCLTTPFAYPTGKQVVYSDVGYILLGLVIAKLNDRPLDAAMRWLVQKPLDLTIRYGPLTTNVAPTEFCQWRQRRIIGEVHDENSATLHGVAGHAGLFGTAADCAHLGQLYLDHGGGFISERIAREAVHRQIEDRGLGWMMRSPEGSSSGHLFSANSYGHTGFVGNSLWVDPERELVAVLLTNNVFYGRDKEAIVKFRPLFHDTLIQAL